MTIRRNFLVRTFRRSLFVPILFLFLSLHWSLVTFAAYEYQTNCVQDAFSDSRIEYCISRETTSQNKDVLYFFHGIFGNVHSWDGDGRGIRQEWEKQQVSPPTVVTISAGNAWLLNDENDLMLSGLLPVFLNEVFPKLERDLQKLGLSVSMGGRRFLYGVSMGGFNAIQLFTRRPGWFDKVALVSPAIPTVSPFANVLEIGDYVNRTSSNWRDVMVALTVASLHFPDEETWDEASPIKLVHKVGRNFPPLYVGVTTRDTYGFQEGDLLYADIAKSKGVPVLKSYYPGDHALVRVDEIVNFFK